MTYSLLFYWVGVALSFAWFYVICVKPPNDDAAAIMITVVFAIFWPVVATLCACFVAQELYRESK